MSQPPPGGSPQPSQHDVQAALARAHTLVQQGQPLQALKVVADLLRASGLEREAGESVARVQQALAAGSSSAQAADELAGLLSLMGLQPSQGAAPMDSQQQQQQPHHLQHHHYQQPVLSSGSGPAGMEVEGGTGPGPPPSGAGGDAELAGRVAAAEGASLVCPRCGGVVAAARFEVHCTLWCPALQR